MGEDAQDSREPQIIGHIKHLWITKLQLKHPLFLGEPYGFVPSNYILCKYP